MSALITYHLLPPAGASTLSFHFGRQGIGLEEASETLASDSLFAALVAQAAKISRAREPNGEPAWVTPFDTGNPPLALSSLFPRLGGLVLLPRPALPIPAMAPALRDAIGKGFKKLRYLSPQLFAAVCAGRAIEAAPLISQGGKVWISPDEADLLPTEWRRQQSENDDGWRARLNATAIWQIESLPRVTVDRTSNASAYYEVGRVTYTPDAGLALLVRFADPQAQQPFESLLSLLGDSGLGGRRSSGYGAFRWERGPALQLDLPAAGPRSVLLSRYVPHGDAELAALQNQAASYQLVDVHGWLYSVGKPAQRRAKLRMVAEGAVIAAAPEQVRGTLVDVRPVYSAHKPHPQLGAGPGVDHPVYRSGLALTLAIPAATEARP
jgi:CRISPR-associated protein Csm4